MAITIVRVITIATTTIVVIPALATTTAAAIPRLLRWNGRVCTSRHYNRNSRHYAMDSDAESEYQYQYEDEDEDISIYNNDYNTYIETIDTLQELVLLVAVPLAGKFLGRRTAHLIWRHVAPCLSVCSK